MRDGEAKSEEASQRMGARWWMEGKSRRGGSRKPAPIFGSDVIMTSYPQLLAANLRRTETCWGD